MSGIIGIYRRDGRPVDTAQINRLTHFLAYRGPDGLGSWASGPVGFGHSMLRSSHYATRENQPYLQPPQSSSQECELSIVADARIDCRSQLRGLLAVSGRQWPSDATDPELILAAYSAWGEDCVHHLRGDFSFVIWDQPNKKLFCARDHFGLKPFYYADQPSAFLFSNTLHSLLLHPAIPAEFNDSAIADFLLFGMNYDVSTTPFRDIRRLPPAHILTVSPDGLKMRRYWQPPTSESIRYRDDRDYVIHFNEILRGAVRDRVQSDHSAILLSGGLDSAAVAATARDLMHEFATPRDLRAYTITFELLLGDREQDYARKTASFLNLPICTIELDGRGIFSRDVRAEFAPPEPTLNSLLNGEFRHFQSIAAHSRIALCGEGNDNLMDFQMWPYVRHLSKTGKWRELIRQGSQFLKARQFPWRGIRARAAQWLDANSESHLFPEWISLDLDRRLHLRQRWAAGTPLLQTSTHSLIPRGYASLCFPHWTNLFEGEDPGATGCNVEVRYPFLDLRMVHYLLALPPYPWFFKKTLVRMATIGRLPEEVRVRPKTPLQGDPIRASLERQAHTLQPTSWDPALPDFVGTYSVSRLENQILTAQNGVELEMALRPLCLNFWLQSIRSIRYKQALEGFND